VVLCANKSDLSLDVDPEEEMMPIMLEFKVFPGGISIDDFLLTHILEIDSCIRASAKEQKNINEVSLPELGQIVN